MAATSGHASSFAHNFACFAATPARSSSATRSFHLSTSFADLSRALLGAGKHPLSVDALLRRFVQRLAGGMIGHMNPNAHGRTYQRILYKLGRVPGEEPALAGRRSIESGLGCPFQDGWRCHLPRVVMLRGRWFVRLWFRFGDGFCRVGFECGEDDGGCLLDDFQTLSE